MRKLLFILFVLGAVLPAQAQQIKAYTATDVMKSAASPDTVYIINFWATWCPPCVQELPEFNKLYDKYKAQPVKILMVSLDFKDSYPYKLEGFVKRKGLQPEVAWLSDTDPNVFIPKIEGTWQGSIPATLILRQGQPRKFIEGQVTVAQVSRIVDAMLPH